MSSAKRRGRLVQPNTLGFAQVSNAVCTSERIGLPAVRRVGQASLAQPRAQVMAPSSSGFSSRAKSFAMMAAWRNPPRPVSAAVIPTRRASQCCPSRSRCDPGSFDAGILLAGSSGLPVVENLRQGMQSAVDRRTGAGSTLAPAEAITPEGALGTHTEWAARATGQISDKGTLGRGKLADFTVFSASPLTAESIAELDIVATVLGDELSTTRGIAPSPPQPWMRHDARNLHPPFGPCRVLAHPCGAIGAGLHPDMVLAPQIGGAHNE